jgi:predicted RNase H-like nuclease
MQTILYDDYSDDDREVRKRLSSEGGEIQVWHIVRTFVNAMLVLTSSTTLIENMW